MSISMSEETTRPTFPWGKRGLVSYGLPLPELVSRHVERLHKERVFVVMSGSLAKHTDCLSRLEKALGPRVVGKQVGFPSHTPWIHVLELASEMRVPL